MVKAKLIALLLLTATVAVAQKPVNHLVYKSGYVVTNKKGTETIAGMGTDVKLSDNLAVISRLKEDMSFNDQYGYRIHDKAKNVTIYDYAKLSQYFLDKTDSILNNTAEAKNISKTATVSGYECKAYYAETVWEMFGKIVGTYKYTFWITEDIVSDESFNDEIVSALTSNQVRFAFKGTLVKIDIEQVNGKNVSKGAVELTKAENLDQANKSVEMPWLRSGTKALLPVISNNPTGYEKDRTTYAVTHSYTTETPQQLYDRLSALYKQVSGLDKLKYYSTGISRHIL